MQRTVSVCTKSPYLRGSNLTKMHIVERSQSNIHFCIRHYIYTYDYNDLYSSTKLGIRAQLVRTPHAYMHTVFSLQLALYIHLASQWGGFVAVVVDKATTVAVVRGDQLGNRSEELDPCPEPDDVVGGAEEQAVGRHRGAAGHQAPQLPHLAPQRRCGPPPVPASAAR